MRMGITVSALALAAGVLLAGCAGEAGTASPTNGAAPNGERTTPTTDQPTNNLPHSGAPPVENPIDTARWEADPCATLSDAQLAGSELTTQEGEQGSDGMIGPNCDWYLDVGTGGFSVAFITPTTEGLSALYQRNESGGYEYWKVLDPIGGYPAVIGMEKEPGGGDCGIAVGVRDDRIFTVQMNDSRDGADDPCGTAVQVAELAIETMTGGD